MPTFIRLTDYNSSEEKEKGFFDPKNRYVAKQEDFEKIPGNPIAYWVSDRVKVVFKKSIKLQDIDAPILGIASHNDEYFLRLWTEVEIKKIGFGFKNRDEAKKSGLKWFPYNKGGEFRRWYGNNEYVVNYESDGKEIKEYPKGQTNNEHKYFKKGLTWSRVTTGFFSVRYHPYGFIMGDAGPSAFAPDEKIFYLLAFLNTKIVSDLLKVLNPTINYQIGDISNIPVIFSKYDSLTNTIDLLAQECIEISKEDWDSRETSWDFSQNKLLKHKTDDKIENAYNNYCEYWREKFFKLHSNEEELNRLFIDIYELQDELTPDVPLDKITILKEETKIVDGDLVFKKDAIIKQFISYAVGCMFGRYSIDKEGLILANLGETLEDYINQIPNPSFTPDDDNIIPVFEFDFFEDDIVSRFKEFLKITFSEKTLYENLSFIADAIGKKSSESDEDAIRRYFHKEFYSDHVSRYKKRPIYWMFSSNPKGAGAFNVLIYMHRYYPGIVAKIRTDYLHPYMEKLESEKNRLQQSIDNNVLSGQTLKKAQSTIDKIEKYLIELREYDVRLKHYADKMIKINLDDGVKVNYCKFQDILVVFDNKLCK